MIRLLAAVFIMICNVGIIMAQEAAPAAAAAGAASSAAAVYFDSIVIATMIGLGIAAGLCGVGQGLAVSGGLQGIARQPEATSKIQLNMIIGLAFIESLVLYTLFIGIILLYVNPFMKYLVK
jgi:F-type H+-transporting ATPase subunit c